MGKIGKNYILSVLYQILVIIVPLITAPYLTRVLGASKLGVYSYTNSVAYYFYLVAMLGINNYGNRTIAAVRDDKSILNKTFSEIVTLQILFGTLIFFAYALYVFFMRNNELYFIPSLFWGLYVCSGIFDINWFYWGLEEFSITIFRSVVIKIVATVLIFMFVKDVNLYVLIISGSSFVGSLIIWVNCIQYVHYEKPTIRNVIKHLKPNLILFIPVIAVSIYTVMDKIMLGHISDITSLGYYDNVQKIMVLPTGIITALGSVMLPRISNLLNHKKTEVVLQYLDVSMQFSSFFSIALMFGLAAIAPTFTTVYFGKDFSDTYFLMELFSITIVFIAWANVIRTQFLIPKKKDGVYILSVCIGAVVNIVFNIFLIPIYNEIGAVIGTIVAEFSVALVQTIAVHKLIPISTYLKNGIIFFIPGIIMFYVVRLIESFLGISIVSLCVQVIVGGMLYILVGFFFLLCTRSYLGNRISKRILKDKKD